MAIDRKVEQATRTMLGHAMRHELDALADTIQSLGNETFLATSRCAWWHPPMLRST